MNLLDVNWVTCLVAIKNSDFNLTILMWLTHTGERGGRRERGRGREIERGGMKERGGGREIGWVEKKEGGREGEGGKERGREGGR